MYGNCGKSVNRCPVQMISQCVNVAHYSVAG
jgi:hypothetical protein